MVPTTTTTTTIVSAGATATELLATSSPVSGSKAPCRWCGLAAAHVTEYCRVIPRALYYTTSVSTAGIL
ncbi:hypothetical protein V9T40_000715 [Parthenolecanium corni]|uniref:Uncharacterized protein n=1 Tax=Parthenolecanium corni TaxID=536013 RepID=A0AAN9TBJ1_9HEMI